MPVALFCGRVRGNYPDGNRRQPPAAARLRPFGRENGRAFAQRYLYYTIFALIASLFCPFSQLFLKCPRSRVFLAISCGFSAPFPLFFLLPPWPFLLLHRPGTGIMRGLPGRLPAGRGGGGRAQRAQGRGPEAPALGMAGRRPAIRRPPVRPFAYHPGDASSAHPKRNGGQAPNACPPYHTHQPMRRYSRPIFCLAFFLCLAAG